MHMLQHFWGPGECWLFYIMEVKLICLICHECYFLIRLVESNVRPPLKGRFSCLSMQMKSGFFDGSNYSTFVFSFHPVLGWVDVYINYITAWFIYLQRISLEAEAEKITVFAGCVCSRMNRTNVNNVWIVIKIVVWFLKESYFEWVKMALLCNWFHEIRTPPANHSISTDLGLCMLQPRRDFRTAPLLHYAYNS